MRRIATFLAVSLACAILFVAGSGRARGGSGLLTRLRLRLDSTALWSSVSVPGAQILATHVIGSSPGSSVGFSRDGMTVNSVQPSWAVGDVIMKLSRGTAGVQVAKDRFGSATGTVTRHNTAEVLISRVSDSTSTGNCVVNQPVASSTLIGEGISPPMLDPRRLTLAMYYPWWDSRSFSSGFWLDRPAGPFDTSQPAGVAGQVAQAKAAGVDGFVASWDGAASGPQRFDLLLGAAQARPGFAVAPGVDSIEIAQAFGPGVTPLEDQVRAVLQRAASPAFLVSNGRPVVFLYGAFQLQPAVWTTVRQDLAASGLNPFVVGDNSDPAFGFDGLYSYSPNRLSGTTLYDYNQGAMDHARLPALVDPNRRQQLWMATVSPGQDDLLIRPLNATAQSRRGGARYDDTWRDALASSPEWVMVTSWNEWYEDTVIAPSTAYGSRALDQTRRWASTFATFK